MVLTRNFRETIYARAKKDAAYRESMLTEAIDCLLAGDVETGKTILRDYINATIGFENLGEHLHKPSKSLHRMLSTAGNPNTKNFFEILSCLRMHEGLDFTVTTHRRQKKASRSTTGVREASVCV
jgi:hypothetical protein